MSHDEIGAFLRRWCDMAARPNIWRASTYRVRGSRAGRQAEMEASFANLKAAVRSGDWWRDTGWRRVVVTAVRTDV